MKLTRYKVYILIFLFIVIITRIYSVIRNVRIIYEAEKVSVLYQITQIKDTCWYSSDMFYFKITECRQAKIGETYLLTGTVDATSDKGVFSKKRLMVEDKKLVAVNNNSLYSWKSLLAGWKNHIWKKLSEPILESLPPLHAVVLLSMVFGEQEKIAEETKELFRKTGTSHLQAVSGYNFAVIAAGIHSVVEKFAKKKNQGLCILVVSLFFAYIVGMQPSVIRALGTLITILIARFLLMYQYNSTFSLCFVLYFMVFWRPIWLFSIGFQLSVGAVIGILYFQPILQRSLDSLVAKVTKISPREVRVPAVFSDMASGFTTSIAASITTAPILLFHFHELSLMGVVISSLFASILNVIVLLGFWTAITASIVYNSLTEPLVSIWIKLTLYLPLELFLSSIEWFSQIKFLNFKIEVFPWWLCLGWYVGLFLIWRYNYYKTISRNARERLFV